MSYSKFSENAAKNISTELGFDTEKQQVIAYSIESLLLTVVGFISIVIFGTLFGAALPAAVAAVSGGFLRRLSGGAHAKTATRCLIFGTLGYGALGILSKVIFQTMKANVNIKLLSLGLFISLIIVIIYAPVDCAAKPIASQNLRKKLRIASITFILILLILILLIRNPIIQMAVTFGVLYQAITLLPIFNKKRG